MDFDDAKENIQPLAQGRNASILHASLKVESQELLAQRKELELEIRNYTGDVPLCAWFAQKYSQCVKNVQILAGFHINLTNFFILTSIGDDPLYAWYNYIEWIEQSFPSGGKESGLQEVLSKCLSQFESDQKYYQDRRMIKLYIKFIDSHKDPGGCYQQLFNAGIGTMVADFYIAWAYCYDLVGNNRKADEIFRRGIACRAQPLEDLQEAHQHFGFTVAQRFIYKDDDTVKEETNRQLQERRLALTSLRGHRRKQMVGSKRTGSAVKSFMPGTIKSDAPSTSQHSNVRVQVFNGENESPNIITTPHIESNETATSEEGKSVVRSIIDAARNQENQREPGPWNKAHLRKKGKLFGKTTITNELGFEIHEDDKDIENKEHINKPCIPPIPIAASEIKFGKPFIYPKDFCGQSQPIKGWETPVTTEEEPDKNTIPQYNKCKLYPRPNVEFQLEELKAYYVMKKRGIENDFCKERDIYWGCGPDYNVRLYPHFAKKSKPQKMDAVDEPYIPDFIPNLKVPFNEMYNKEEHIERQIEEILAMRIKRNETVIKTTDMEETMCISSEKQQRRKSFFPLRKSLAPSAIKAVRKVSIIPECVEQNETDLREDNEKSIVRDIENPLAITLFGDVANMPSEIKPYSPKSTITNHIEAGPNEQFAKCFQIYHDESVVEISSNLPPPLSNKPSQLEGDFQFKTPALPISNPAISTPLPKSNKINFEIFEDESATNKHSPNNIPKPDFGCGTGGFFDPEETCSTQTFNVFLKSQSVSTPKVIAKSQPQRLFSNVLKEIAPTVPEQQQVQQAANNDLANENSPSETAGYSPPRQQLSTILETSEQCSTQGTHTTGATTKSTFSSPEFEIESQVQTTTTYAQVTALKTITELSRETSTITLPEGNVEELMNSLIIENKPDFNMSKQYQQHLATPCALRLQKRSEGGGLNFSIFEETPEQNEKQVGNFSRLEEKEDTAAGLVFKSLPPIRFQDDKTETIPNNLLAPLHGSEDKTETISKMLMAPLQNVQYPEDETETISKMFLAPPQSIKFPEDKTETISKFMLAPPQPIIFEDKIDTPLPQNPNSREIQEPMNQDDSFNFFGETPPKIAKHLPPGKLMEKRDGPLTQIRTAADARTPLTLDSKRFCDKETPDIQKSKSRQAALFEDELHSQNIVNTNELSPEHSLNSKAILRDSSITDFVLTEDSQNKGQPNKIIQPIKTSKSVFRDSFIPDFSIIEDPQPQSHRKSMQTKQVKTTNNSFLPDLSIIEDSQPQVQQKPPTQTIKVKSTNNSFLPDFSYIPETQRSDSIIMQSQPMEPRILKQNCTKSSLHRYTELTRSTTDNQLINDVASHWKQTPNPKRVANQTQEGTTLKNILMDTFMKDFSEINEPPPIPKDVKEMTMVQPSKNNSALRFINETLQQKTPISYKNDNKNINVSLQLSTSSKEKKLSFLEPPSYKNDNNKSKNINVSIQLSTSSKETKLSFLEPPAPSQKSPAKENKSTASCGNRSDDKYFELNCETEMFGTNMSMIKNSTWLPNHDPTIKMATNIKPLSNIQEDSLHIKHEDISTNTLASTSNLVETSKFSNNSAKTKLSFMENSNNFSVDISATELAVINNAKKLHSKKTSLDTPEFFTEPEDDCEMSIYYKHTPKTPKVQVHIWDDADAFKSPTGNNRHMYTEPDLNQTHQLIENICIDPNVNPFNDELKRAFLEHNDFINYLERHPNCMLVGSTQRLKQNSTINVNGVKFEVYKLIAEGSYGAVFRGKETSTGKIVAMKQEKPPNNWEYYICLEIQDRIQIDEMLPAYMSIDNALIGNNASILISSFSQYGSLISVCNKIKKYTMKNVDEYVVMLMACELLEIMDHLHAVNIIHADIKADNFLLFNKLRYPSAERCLQLIDFGVSIDMKLFKPGQTFSFIHNENLFKCPEMREERPWTYQLDLYGLAGVIHVLLFGKYMDIEKKSSGIWLHKTHVPRYFKKTLWDTIFKSLLNIRDCNSMPNLQDLRALLKEEIEENEKYVVKMVMEFNKALNN